MSLTTLKNRILDFGRDIRLNLDSVLSETGTPGLTAEQARGIALACAYGVEDPQIVHAFEAEYRDFLTPELREAAKAAATIMAMNNVYYRFLHLAEDPDLGKLPARLRMNVIGKPGIAKVDFELMCLAVSAMAGCGNCVKSHIQEARKAGISHEGIQSAARIAAVLQGARRALFLSQIA
jgi:alkyl hydroperoxide reductase subunit D